MAYLLVQQTVEDYGKWRKVFEESEGANPSGAKSIRIFRSAENPNEITVLAEWDTMDNARRFSIPPEVMKRAGVVGQVVIRFLDEVSLP